MTRREDDKRGGPDSELTEHGRKVEARNTKQMHAKTGQDGRVDARKMGRDSADNTGGKGHNDIQADLD
jgi:hypothetical protein